MRLKTSLLQVWWNRHALVLAFYPRGMKPAWAAFEPGLKLPTGLRPASTTEPSFCSVVLDGGLPIPGCHPNKPDEIDAFLQNRNAGVSVNKYEWYLFLCMRISVG